MLNGMNICHGCGDTVTAEDTMWDTATPYCIVCHQEWDDSFAPVEPERDRVVLPGDPSSEGSMMLIEDILCSDEWSPDTLDAIADVVRRWAKAWEENYTI